jgi:hypothetical protein
MYEEDLTRMIVNWLFRPARRSAGFMKFRLLYELLMSVPEVNHILSRECPYCHKRFKTFSALHGHLELTGLWLGWSTDDELRRCRKQFKKLLKDVVDTYYELKGVIHYGRGKYYVKGLGYFRTFEEAYQKAKELLSQSSRPTS